MFSKARPTAGRPAQVVPHDLRHTTASLAIASGADVKAVQAMLGHQPAKMTLDREGHLWDRPLDDVGDAMGKLVRRYRSGTTGPHGTPGRSAE
ncbi:tyrosine-type recombinase/integrase [Raineyella sp. LH-20]|uniref:tyrosine-type recombinase/integrase n=1 Tax=Raineyella sp. LH-20 TaxID=3081204 RepID=UPI00398764B1